MPNGVIGNTTDSGSVKSRFEPWLGNKMQHYNWKTYPTMNVEFWQKHQNTLLADAKAKLKKSHRNVMALI